MDIYAIGFSVVTLMGVLVGVWLLRSITSAGLEKFIDRIKDIVSGQERLERSLRDDIGKSRGEASEQARNLREEVNVSIKGFGEFLSKTFSDSATSQMGQLEMFAKQMAKFTEQTQFHLNEVAKTVDKRLSLIQDDNNKKHDEMRITVGEKLDNTLNRRLNESFQLISDRLEKVHQGLGEMQTLTSGVGDLKRIFTNVKSRGTWGEYQLSDILEQILTPEQYQTNVQVKRGSSERVEFAVRMPGQDDGKNEFVYLPIDAKFPQEDYQRLLIAQETGDQELAKEATKALEESIKRQARTIRDKYISEPVTTPFAVMFLPTESLYAEVLRRPGLAEHVQTNYRIMIAGPTNLTALLQTLRVGFRTLAIQKRSSEVWGHLAAIKKQFAGFSEILDKVHKRIETASSEVEEAAKKSRNIGKKLEKFEELPVAATPLVGISDGVLGES